MDLTFIAQAYFKTSRDLWDEKRRLERKLKNRASIFKKAPTNPKIRGILESINNQLKESEHTKSKLICPECHRNFVIVKVKGIEMEYCLFCKGCWLEEEELKSLSESTSEIPVPGLRERKSRYKCPVCKAGMTECVFKRRHNLLVDKCPRDHGIYLENKELERVLRISWSLN